MENRTISTEVNFFDWTVGTRRIGIVAIGESGAEINNNNSEIHNFFNIQISEGDNWEQLKREENVFASIMLWLNAKYSFRHHVVEINCNL